MNMRAVAFAVLTMAGLAAVPVAFAEPPKAVEAVGHFGSLRHAGDEGSIGDSAAWGGTLTLPFAQRWAVELDAVTGRTESFDDAGLGFRSRRTLFASHLQYRRGTEKVYGFIGLGPGWQREAEEGRALFQLPGDSGPAARNYSRTDTRFAPLGYKAGIVINPTKRLLIRGEVLLQHAYTLPNIMARVGIGWRF